MPFSPLNWSSYVPQQNCPHTLDGEAQTTGNQRVQQSEALQLCQPHSRCLHQQAVVTHKAPTVELHQRPMDIWESPMQLTLLPVYFSQAERSIIQLMMNIKVFICMNSNQPLRGKKSSKPSRPSPMNLPIILHNYGSKVNKCNCPEMWRPWLMPLLPGTLSLCNFNCIFKKVVVCASASLWIK